MRRFYILCTIYMLNMDMVVTVVLFLLVAMTVTIGFVRVLMTDKPAASSNSSLSSRDNIRK